MEQRDLLALGTMVMISREKHGMETFFLPRCRIEEKGTYMSKVKPKKIKEQMHDINNTE